MKEIYVYLPSEIPFNFTGKVVWRFGNVSFLKDGNLHKEDGPARIHRSGIKHYYLYGTQYSKEEWFSLLTPEQQIAFLMNPGNF